MGDDGEVSFCPYRFECEVVCVLDKDIHVGDVVRVRQWNDMAKEYGIKVDNSTGRKYCSIPIKSKHTCFSEDMEEFCGLTFTVRERYRTEAHGYGFRFVGNSQFGRWYFACAEMLEAVDNDEEFDVASDKDIRLLFS